MGQEIQSEGKGSDTETGNFNDKFKNDFLKICR